MSQSKPSNRSIKDILFAVGPTLIFVLVALFLAKKYINPALPNRVVISTSESEGDYQLFAQQYRDIMKDNGVTLEIRSSTGAVENLSRLQDEKSDVDVGFVQDGMGSSETETNLLSLGSLYYEPIWVFYRGRTLQHLSELVGKRVAVGQAGGGTRILSMKLLNASGVTEKNAKFVDLGWANASSALREDKIDAAIFLATPEDIEIKKLIHDRSVHLMSMDQAEAITRQVPYLHHLVLPHGALDLKENLPAQDIDLVSPTATLLIKDSLHPALIYLLLKAASQVHDEPGIFEKKNEFPNEKSYEFPLSDEAKQFYKTGTPFWQRYLPFWLAALVERFILVIIPLLALILPLIRTVPKLYQWRIRRRFYQRYGELKYIETQIRSETTPEKHAQFLKKLDEIEDRVNHMKVPPDFTEHVFALRGHIHFVRERLLTE